MAWRKAGDLIALSTSAEVERGAIETEMRPSCGESST